MAKIILEFDMHEDRAEYEQALRANKYYCVIWEFLQYCRGIVKHGSEEQQPTTWEDVRTKMYELINEESIGDEF